MDPHPPPGVNETSNDAGADSNGPAGDDGDLPAHGAKPTANVRVPGGVRTADPARSRTGRCAVPAVGRVDTYLPLGQRWGAGAVEQRVLTLKDMTRGSGCTPRTVRYYERQGLLRALRSAGGHRLFAASELERLKFIISLREAGWTLEEVVELLQIRESASGDAQACVELERMLLQRIDRLEQKIRVLVRLREDLGNTAQLLPVCQTCTGEQDRVQCTNCSRVPALSALPQAFRLIWRARELDGAALYDEVAADAEDAGSGDHPAEHASEEPVGTEP